jgi:hypothetical protein
MKASTAKHSTRAGRLLPALAFAGLASSASALENRDVPPVFKPAEAPANAVREPAYALAEKSTDRIVREMEQKYKARLVKAPEERVVKGRKVLALRLFDDKKGKVYNVQVDAETGKEL